MEVIYGLIPGMIVLGLVGLGVFFWAARSGQFDDMEGEAHRILMDDDLSPRLAGGKEVKRSPESTDASEGGRAE